MKIQKKHILITIAIVTAILLLFHIFGLRLTPISIIILCSINFFAINELITNKVISTLLLTFISGISGVAILLGSPGIFDATTSKALWIAFLSIITFLCFIVFNFNKEFFIAKSSFFVFGNIAAIVFCVIGIFALVFLDVLPRDFRYFKVEQNNLLTTTISGCVDYGGSNGRRSFTIKSTNFLLWEVTQDIDPIYGCA